MRSKRERTRSLALLLAAGALCLALTASAAAVVYVYENGFGSKGDFKEIKRTGGGADCGKRYRDSSSSMGVTVRGKGLCELSPPVVGDASQPNHVVYARGKFLPKTPKALRKAAYFAVKVRMGGGDSYELQIRPKGNKYKLLRSPSSNAVSEKGQSNAVNPFKRPNALRLEVKGARVKAFVNGQQVASVMDPNPEVLGGRRVGFGIGSGKDSDRTIHGVFERVRVGLAD